MRSRHTNRETFAWKTTFTVSPASGKPQSFHRFQLQTGSNQPMVTWLAINKETYRVLAGMQTVHYQLVDPESVWTSVKIQEHVTCKSWG